MLSQHKPCVCWVASDYALSLNKGSRWHAVDAGSVRYSRKLLITCKQWLCATLWHNMAVSSRLASRTYSI